MICFAYRCCFIPYLISSHPCASQFNQIPAELIYYSPVRKAQLLFSFRLEKNLQTQSAPYIVILPLIFLSALYVQQQAHVCCPSSKRESSIGLLGVSFIFLLINVFSVQFFYICTRGFNLEEVVWCTDSKALSNKLVILAYINQLDLICLMAHGWKPLN